MVIRMRHTPSHTKNRRSHHALQSAATLSCAQCNAPTLPHRVCAHCGFYRGRKVVDVLRKLDKKTRKAREKEIQQP
ncbi:MAG TPA: 50S ribosomal protein L32 [Candidatus Paceibacterota bacterium]